MHCNCLWGEDDHCGILVADAAIIEGVRGDCGSKGKGKGKVKDCLIVKPEIKDGKWMDLIITAFSFLLFFEFFITLITYGTLSRKQQREGLLHTSYVAPLVARRGRGAP